MLFAAQINQPLFFVLQFHFDRRVFEDGYDERIGFVGVV